MTNNNIVQKLWNLCDVLRDDDIHYSDYVTELVLRLFIKMVHENTEAGLLGKRGMRRFKSINQAQRFPESHAAVYKLFNLHRRSLRRRFFKLFRLRSFAAWDAVTAS